MLCDRRDRQTDRRTERRTPYRYIDAQREASLKLVRVKLLVAAPLVLLHRPRLRRSLLVLFSAAADAVVAELLRR